MLSFFEPLSTYLHFLIFLLIVDAGTSIYYQAKERLDKLGNRNSLNFWARLIVFFKTIESARLRTTLEKMVAYILWLMICFMFDKIVLKIDPLQGSLFNYLSISNVAVLMMCMTEMTSITANFSKITRNPIYNNIMKIFRGKVEDKMRNDDIT